MRLVQLLVGDEQRDAASEALEAEGIDYLLLDESSRGTVVEFPLPSEAVEYVLDRLDEAGVDCEYVVTLSAESARSDGIQRLEERFVEGREEGDSVASDEIRATALDLHPDPSSYYAMTVLSAVVAVAGLLLDSAALVVGSMVIAPQIASAVGVAVGAVLEDWPMVRNGIRDQLLSLGLVVATAGVLSWSLRTLAFVPPIHLDTIGQVGERVSPGLLALGVGVCAGIAGAIGIATGLPVSLVGVMVAAALIPAAAAVGIGLAWGDPSVALGALVLLLANVGSINIGGAATLRVMGYQAIANEKRRRRRSVIAVAVVVLIVLVGAGMAVAAQASFENDVNEGVESVLDENAYEELELDRVQTEFVAGRGAETTSVTVELNRPVDEPYPNLAETLADVLSTKTGYDVHVTVEFTEQQRSASKRSPWMDVWKTDTDISYREIQFIQKKPHPLLLIHHHPIRWP